MKPFLLFFFLFLLYCLSFGAHDISVRYYLKGGEHAHSDNIFSIWNSEIKVDYTAEINLSENVFLMLNESIDGMTVASEYSPFTLNNHPSNAISKIGLKFTRFGFIRTMAYSHVLLNSKKIKFPVYFGSPSYLNDAEMLQRQRGGFDFYWQLPIHRFLGEVDATYSYLSYDYSRFGHVVPNQRDIDVWVKGSAGISFLKEKLWFTIAGIGKYDFNNYSGYNYLEGLGGFEGTFRFYKKRIRGLGGIYGRYTLSPILKERGLADEIGLLSQLRVIYRIKPRFYLKGSLNGEIAPVENQWYIKQKYNLSLRKVWKNFSHIEGGGWGSFGSLFPRLCGYINGVATVTPNFELQPEVKGYASARTVKSWRFTGVAQPGEFDTLNTVIKIVQGKEIKIVKDGNMFEKVQSFEKYTPYRMDFGLTFFFNLENESLPLFDNMKLVIGGKYNMYFKNPEEEKHTFVSLNETALRFTVGLTSHF